MVEDTQLIEDIYGRPRKMVDCIICHNELSKGRGTEAEKQADREQIAGTLERRGLCSFACLNIYRDYETVVAAKAKAKNSYSPSYWEKQANEAQNRVNEGFDQLRSEGATEQDIEATKKNLERRFIEGLY